MESDTLGILDLDDPRCTDPSTAGAKAAWLARARNVGLPVLPGVVVPAAASHEAMRFGAEVLIERGPGSARLAIAQHPLPYAIADALPGRAAALGGSVIVRSSSLLEDNGEWAGAFESLVVDHVDAVAAAVSSCYASAFATSTLERASAAEIPAGSVPMALVVQPLVVPTLGGVAHVVDGQIDIITGDGPSMGMLEGSDSSTSPIPDEVARRVKELLQFANHELGITACEWALVDGDVVLLQVKRAVRRLPETPDALPDVNHPEARRVAAVLRRAPGPLGRHFVLPWALSAEPPLIGDVTALTPTDTGPIRALDRADEIARTLTAEVWQRARPMAWEDAVRVLDELAGSDPRSALVEIARLRRPDAHRVGEILPMVGRVLLAISGLRHSSPISESWYLEVRHAVGLLMGDAPSPWTTEPDPLEAFDVAVVKEFGASMNGLAAAPGRRSGRACFVADATQPDGYRPRDVVIAPTADRDLAPLLWTAAGLVTGKGTPAAHLFEVARARGIPAVCGADLDFFSGDPESVCVDGSAGTVHALPW